MFRRSQVATATNWVQSNQILLGRHEHYSKFDAQIKYSYILSMVDDLLFSGQKKPLIIELGSGDGHISRAVSRLARQRVLAVDIQSRRFILDRPKKFFDEVKYYFRNLQKHKNSRVTYVKSEALAYLSRLKPESVDCFIDACSATHFGDYKKFIELAERALKPGGVLIAASDVLLNSSSDMKPVHELRGHEFLTEKELIELVAVRLDVRKLCSAPKVEFENDTVFEYSPYFVNGRPLRLAVTGFVAQKIKTIND